MEILLSVRPFRPPPPEGLSPSELEDVGQGKWMQRPRLLLCPLPGLHGEVSPSGCLSLWVSSLLSPLCNLQVLSAGWTALFSQTVSGARLSPPPPTFRSVIFFLNLIFMCLCVICIYMCMCIFVCMWVCVLDLKLKVGVILCLFP